MDIQPIAEVTKGIEVDMPAGCQPGLQELEVEGRSNLGDRNEGGIVDHLKVGLQSRKVAKKHEKARPHREQLETEDPAER